jgi:hypothetical protein
VPPNALHILNSVQQSVAKVPKRKGWWGAAVSPRAQRIAKIFKWAFGIALILSILWFIWNEAKVLTPTQRRAPARQGA